MELKALSRLGWSVTALAREYGLSRTTIYKELASPSPRHYERAKPTALSEPQLIHIERRLTVCPNVRGTDLHVELRRGIHCLGLRDGHPGLGRQGQARAGGRRRSRPRSW